jgi:hypothetical protein
MACRRFPLENEVNSVLEVAVFENVGKNF